MYEVHISPFGSDDDFSHVPVSSFPNVESAIGFALELHRVSNLPHYIVVADDRGEVVVSLSLEPKKK